MKQPESQIRKMMLGLSMVITVSIVPFTNLGSNASAAQPPDLGITFTDKDYERSLASSEAMIYIASIHTMLKRLAPAS